MSDRAHDLLDAYEAVIKHLAEIRAAIEALRNEVDKQKGTIGDGRIRVPPIIVTPPPPPSALGQCAIRRPLPEMDPQLFLDDAAAYLGESLHDCANTISASGTWRQAQDLA